MYKTKRTTFLHLNDGTSFKHLQLVLPNTLIGERYGIIFIFCIINFLFVIDYY